jgi:uroporphyrinogen decarboxylase
VNGRERFIRAVLHMEPDRVPTFFRRSGGIALSTSQKSFIDSIIDVGEYINMRSPTFIQNPDGLQVDELGIGYRQKGFYTEMVHHPLSDFADPLELDDYPWPNFNQAYRIEGLRAKALEIREKGKAVAVMGSWGGSTGPFELSWYMRGMENFLCDLVDNLPFAEKLLDIQLSLHIDRWRIILNEIGDLADVICTGDDLGTQTGPLIAPQLYRDIVKPRHRALLTEIHRHTKAPIYFHSCGAIAEFIPDLIDIGVKILDPVQPNSLPLGNIKERYGDNLCFYGGVDVQRILPYGSIQEVKNEVFQRFEQLGRGGGLVLGPSHWLQPDVPWDNIEAMYEAILECKY